MGQLKKKKKKQAMGLGESFTFLAKSPYIRDLATLVRCADTRARPESPTLPGGLYLRPRSGGRAVQTP